MSDTQAPINAREVQELTHEDAWQLYMGDTTTRDFCVDATNDDYAAELISIVSEAPLCGATLPFLDDEEIRQVAALLMEHLWSELTVAEQLAVRVSRMPAQKALHVAHRMCTGFSWKETSPGTVFRFEDGSALEINGQRVRAYAHQPD